MIVLQNIRIFLFTCLLLLVITDQTWPALDTHPPVLEDQCRQGHPDHYHCCTDQSWQQLGCVRWAQKASGAVLHYIIQCNNPVINTNNNG